MATGHTSSVIARRAALALVLAGWAATASAGDPVARVAVFPVENLSGGSAPAGLVEEAVVERLVAAGVDVLDANALDAFMTRHRVRYAAGIDAATADLLRRETGADAVLVVTIELSSEVVPPKVAMLARLVSIRSAPVVVWADEVGLAGDEAPGLLGLGRVVEYEVLLARAVDHLAGSLLRHVAGGEARPPRERGGRYRPRVAYQGLRLEPARTHTVAVLPFFNRSTRRNAGEVLALLFMRHLSTVPAFRVLDTGEVRQQLLQARVIMDGGISLSDAERVAEVLDADFVLGGRVLYYEDYEGPEANPRVDFSVVLIERRSGRVVWSSHSYNDGADGAGFFGRGRLATAHALATRMAGLTVEAIASGGRQ